MKSRRRSSPETVARRGLTLECLERRNLLAAEVLESTFLRDINTLAPPSGASDFVTVGDRLFFVAEDGLHGKSFS